MAPSGADRKPEKSYLSSAVDSINPWSGSRSSTPTPKDPPPQPNTASTARTGDHSITYLYGQSTRSYPADCPPLNVLWYHATDVPKRKPQFLRDKPKLSDDAKPPQQPKKFVPFARGDSRAIESAYQRLLEESEKRRGEQPLRNVAAGSRRGRTNAADEGTHRGLDMSTDDSHNLKSRVPVNEDYLFDVNIEERELAPVYWLGPVYEVRRGTWFYEEGSSLRPYESSRAVNLQRQISSLMEGAEHRNHEEQEEEIRKREEKEIENDYNGQFGESQGREIEHLVLVTHGIGQLLGIRMESVNFVHDVNVLRKNFKAVYASSADLRSLNSELEDGPRNCRVQVLPVCWRHLLDFPKKRERKSERDIGDGALDDDEYPSLEDITIEGVAFARSLISDLALDVLLYQSAYREQIAEIVLNESNRIFKLFAARHPGFKGKVHVIGHSLGSAIMFDILCRQKETSRAPDAPKSALRSWPAQENPGAIRDREANELKFDFDVEDFYCLGSPIGLFQMLKGRTISARHLPRPLPSESPLGPDVTDTPLLAAASGSSTQRVSSITGLPHSVSSPKVSQLFNVFHPSDPISYRLEPLISPAMSSLKPQVLPYTKKGIFSNVTQQGLSGIGMKVGQSEPRPEQRRCGQDELST
ncbi:putative phospholipase [Colletotrichum orbiculare MAFF 240422]|uniref:Phospholipase n=1 Tax=Colletotrichum orbiculare (strain 104-T / ATCC 96160 / CBS 514.97 / LARS 414 / MAFF 240422) TaxID=1213857 RepID=A0A484G3Z8_COLOR|nr:putative phospholipase [Colletotrichum orbiculare MAFF 240422]